MPRVPPFEKVLVANRGEIALRVMRGCRELGVEPVAVYSEADAHAPHVRAANEAYCIGPAASSESYLRGDKILDVARRSGCQAIHPGYGFLSENAGFVRDVVDAGLVFVGPPPEAMEVMGDKVSARRAMTAAGVPVVPGTTDPLESDEEAMRVASEIGYPVMLKASAGGGGKGMRKVDRPEDIASALRGARSEARGAFGDDRVYVEKFVVNPRHVEVQVFSDAQGNHLHLFERDCSIQRRHQKLVEETPCPVLSPETRAAMTAVATQAAAAIGYRGAGTVEFLYGADGSFYFLEMNTRLQVEHPITEMVVGVDLVQAQLLTAAGLPLPWGQDDLVQRGHAIEVRLCAEDPDDGFRPAPGRIESLRLPTGPWVRVDGAFYPGYDVPIHYDPMMAKLIVWGRTRADAIARLRRALDELVITGVRTNAPFYRAVVDHELFHEGRYDTGYVAEHLDALFAGRDDDALVAVLAAAVDAHRAREQRARSVAAPDGGGGSRWASTGRLAQVGR
jgi:acetyl-CoA carboxylase biotin carboxylase subunit